jgi:hypothetical protein
MQGWNAGDDSLFERPVASIIPLPTLHHSIRAPHPFLTAQESPSTQRGGRDEEERAIRRKGKRRKEGQENVCRIPTVSDDQATKEMTV